MRRRCCASRLLCIAWHSTPESTPPRTSSIASRMITQLPWVFMLSIPESTWGKSSMLYSLSGHRGATNLLSRQHLCSHSTAAHTWQASEAACTCMRQHQSKGAAMDNHAWAFALSEPLTSPNVVLQVHLCRMSSSRLGKHCSSIHRQVFTIRPAGERITPGRRYRSGASVDRPDIVHARP